MSDPEGLIRTALSESWRCAVTALECVAVDEGRRCYRATSDRGVLSVKVEPLGTLFDDILQGLRAQQHAAEHGIRTNAALPTMRDALCERLDGYGIVVQPWVDGEPFRAHPEDLTALGEMVGRLHSLPVPEHLGTCWARLEPRRTLDRVRDEVSRLSAEAPARGRADLEEFERRALELDGFPSIPRGIIHTDLAWSNVIDTGEGLALIDFEGAGIGPPIVDLVEVTTYIAKGPSGSGGLLVEQAESFYEGYRRRRRLSVEEIDAFPQAHFYHQFYHLANALARGDYGFIDRMKARLTNWESCVIGQITTIAGGTS